MLVTSAASWAAAQERPSDGALGEVVAVTQNLYIGADIFRIFDAETPEDIPIVVAGILETVIDTDFPERAEALADQIASTEPHLIGLQEVSLIRVQSPGDFLSGNPQPAEDVLHYSPHPVILVGDLNSSPMDSFPQPYPLARAAGYWDMWLERVGGPDPGYTCCQAETVDNTPSMLDERIDHILVRRTRALRMRPVRGPVRSEVLGDEESDKTISGLWPSDHGGVYSRMLIPNLPF